jgi:phosphoglycerate dehydrogenase-like enzyme
VSRSPNRIAVLDLAATSRNWSLPASGRKRLLANAPSGWEVRFVDSPTVSDGDGGTAPSPEALNAVRDAEVYFGFGVSRAIFVAAPRLRWVHSAAAGVGAALFPEMLASDAILTNSAGIHAPPIAQHVVAGVIFLLRSFDIAVDQHRAGVWDKRPFTGDDSTVRELADCQALIIGTGGLGQAIASGLSHFGARCVGVRRRPALGAPPGIERVVGPDALEKELPAADIVVLATPATPATERLLTRERLAMLPRDAIVANVGRGSLLDEVALADELSAGRLRGAVLDVFSSEPLAPESRLWQLRQVLLTPHVSAVSPRRFWERQLDLFADNWTRYAAGKPMLNVVDKHAGY